MNLIITVKVIIIIILLSVYFLVIPFHTEEIWLEFCLKKSIIIPRYNDKNIATDSKNVN